MDYDVQREVVSNTYLDNLLETVLHKRHIPPIVLVADSIGLNDEEGHTGFHLPTFKILDGLQRTYRLNSIYRTIDYFYQLLSVKDTILEDSRLKISRNHSEKLVKLDSNSKMLFEIREKYNETFVPDQEPPNFLDSFDRNQWFEVWTGLSPEDEVKKMLVLNAGHKPVKTKHQLELLFLNLVPILNKSSGPEFKLKREKESSSSFVKNRKLGEFHFSHIITALLSMKEGEPQTTNIQLVHETQSDDFNFHEYEKYFDFKFLEEFLAALVEFDRKIYETYREPGLKWFGREVSLVGVLAALGFFCRLKDFSPIEGMQYFREHKSRIVNSLNLIQYEDLRNSLDLSKVNIGSVNKKAIFAGTLKILLGETESLDWKEIFGQ